MKQSIMSLFAAMGIVLGVASAGLATDVSGTISTNTTWNSAGSPYVVTGNVTVAEGVTLTVEPGIEVSFSRYTGMLVYGSLSAAGSPENPITFTGTTETPDWWREISIQDNGSATFDWCDIGYGGYSNYGGIFKTGTGSLTLKNSTIHHHGSDGLRIEAGYSSFVSSGNTFSNNNNGVKLGINASFEDNTSDFENNGVDFHVDGGTITGDTVWQLKKDYSMYVSGNITVAEAGSLTVKSGTVVKPARYSVISVNGTLNLLGTSASPVYFTDWRDDTVGGDANGDGEESSPDKDWWRAIFVQGTGSATLENCTIRYAGYGSPAGLNKTGSGDLSMTGCTLSHNEGNGLAVENSTGTVTVSQSIFTENSTSGLSMKSGPVNATGCTFSNNGTYGILQEINDSLIYTGNIFTGNGVGGVGVGSGKMTGSITWQAAGSPYVLTGDVTVDEGATLTLEPGVVVQFNQFRRLYVDGMLNAEGTSSSLITFTGTTESPNWWGVIQIRNNGSATFDWCDIGYGAYSDNAGILKRGTGSLALKNSKIHHHGGNGLHIESGYSSFVSSGNTFSNNSSYGVRLGINASFEDNTSHFEDNGVDFYVDGGNITEDTVWHLKKDYSMYVSGNITVAEAGSLTVKSGTVIKPAQFRGISVNGTLDVMGTSASPVYFTDWRDDTVGGDANGDGEESTPDKNWWRGILVQGTGSAILEYCTIRYAGYGSPAGLSKTGSGDLTMTGCAFSHNDGYGLAVENSTGTVTVSQSIFTENSGSGLYMKSGPVNATGCTFSNNGAYGIFQEISDSLLYKANAFSGNASGAVGVGLGTMTGSITWQEAGSPYVVTGNVTVDEGATLTVEPGTEVRFNRYARMLVNGTLDAEGTPENPITFTGTEESPSWWGALSIQNNGSATFDWCDIGYGAYYDNAGILKTGSGSLTIKNSTIHHHGGDGLRITAGSETFVSSGNIFSNNNNGVKLGINTSFEDTSSDFKDNNMNLFVDGGTIDGDTVWQLKKDYSLYVNARITVAGGGSLTIKSGTVVKPKQYVDFLIDGQLTVAGTPADPVYFTDWRDDTVGGDANGDGHESLPATGWWRAIHIRNDGSADIEWCDIAYGGHVEKAGILKTGTGSLTIKNSTIHHHGGDGLRIDDSTGEHTVFRCAFNNSENGVVVKNQATSIMIAGTAIEGNTGYGVLNQNSAEIDARGSWWGHETGPEHTSLNPDGEGDRVSDGVLFDPWRTTPNLAEILSPRRSGTLVQGDAVRLTGAAMDDPAYGYAWNFSDGRRFSEQTPGVVNFPNTGGVRIEYSAVKNGDMEANPDIRDFTVVPDTGTNPDLQAANVLLRNSVAVGQSAVITYTARNVGDGAITGESWIDALYLSRDPYLDAGDILLGNLPVSLDIPEGASYQNTIKANLPVVSDGSWHIIVSINDEWAFLEKHRLNNEKPVSVDLRIPALEAGVGQTMEYDAGPVGQVFSMAAAEGKNLVLDFGPAAAGLEIYVRYGGLPDRRTHDFRLTDGRLSIPSATSGTWYILVYGTMTQPGQYDIEYALTDVSVTAVFPSRFSTLEDQWLTVNGAGFISPLAVELVDAGGAVYSADTVEVDSYTQAAAEFSGGAVPAGIYTVRVSRGSHTDELPNAVEVVAGGKPKFETNLILPARFGYHQLATVYVEYKNAGDAPMPAPLLVVTASQDNQGTPGAIRNGAIMTLDASRLSSGFWTSAMPDGFSNSVQFLASGENPGILQPGESGRVPVYWAGWQKPWDFGYPPFEWQVGVLDANNETAADWDAFKDGMRPDYIREDAWDIIWENYVSMAGATWGDYVRMLSRKAVYLHRQGRRVEDIESMLAMAFREADGISPVSPLARGVDIVVEGPGLDIVFERIFPQPISRRFEMEALGRGWAHNWRYRLTKKSDGTVQITDMTGKPRTFQPDSRYGGRYLAQPGDEGSLRSTGGGYILTEANGMIRAFHADGKLNYIEDANGNRITCGYSGDLLSSLTHSADPSLKLTLNYQGDLIQTVTDHVGRQTTYGYNGDYLASVETFDGRTTTFDYNRTAGSPGEHGLTQVIPPDGAQRVFTYDDQGRLESFYRGNNTEKYTFAYTGGVVSATDLQNHTSRFFFDYAGRIIKVINALGEAVQLAFDDLGNLTTVTDPEGLNTSFTYDNKGNVTKITDAMRQSTLLTYTRNFNRLASITDAKGNQTIFDYDGRGNLTSTLYPDGSKETLVLDDHGSPTEWTNRRGATVSYTYDGQGRIKSKLYGDGSSSTYTYDLRGNLETASNPQGTTEFSYDERDFLARVDYPGERYLKFTYDAGGRRLSSEDQLGCIIHYEYNEDGRLSRLTDTSGAVLVTYEYDEMGRQAKKTTGNGVYAVYGYDAAARLASVVNRKPGGAELSRFEYEYDARGRRISMAAHYGKWTYTYDDLGQLTRAVLSTTDPNIAGRDLAYEYDALGNRVKTTANGRIDNYEANALNQYVQSGDRTYTYDMDGNLIEEIGPDGITRYGYDDENQLISINRGTDEWKYGYDALGNRVSVDKNGEITHHVFDPIGLGNMVGEYSSSGGLIARYVFGLGLLSRVTPAGGNDFYTFDPMGNTSETTGAVGVVKNAYAYMPFGGMLWQNQTAPNPFQFMGELGIVADASGLHQMRARYYDAQTGRFTSPDPIGLAGGDVNFYRYAMNSPNNIVDPLGLSGDIFDSPEFQKEIKRRDRAKNIKNDPELAETYKKGGWGYACNGIGLGITGYSAYLLVAFPATAPVTVPTMIGGFIIMVAPDVYNWMFPSTPTPPAGSGATATSGSAGSADPNEKQAIAGYGVPNYLADGTRVAYRVDFENLASASAPAQFVTVRDKLSEHLDLATFELLEAGFGDVVITIPPGLQYFNKIIDYDYADDEYDFSIQVRVEIWLEGDRLCANFTSLDPANAAFELPPPVDAGFLMPENETGRGQGYVSFAVAPKPGLPSNTAVRNVATIQFDGSLLIDTNQVDPMDPAQGTDPEKEALVTFDTVRPTSTMVPLAEEVQPSFVVSWAGEDADSGIAGYDVYVRENGGDWVLWLSGTTDSSALFQGKRGSLYEFYSVAIDNAGNREEKAPAAEIQTVVADAIPGDINGDGKVDLVDLVLALQICSGVEIIDTIVDLDADVNGDNRIGLVEVSYILQDLSKNQAQGEGFLRSPASYDSDPVYGESDMEAMIDGFSEFTLDFYHALRSADENQDKNLFFSAYSIENALAMTWAGARGQTEVQMADTLHLNLPQERFHPTLNALNIDLNSRDDQPPPSGDPFSLNVVNALWSRIGYPFLPSYLDTIATNYDAGVRVLDFVNNWEGSRQTINQWVEDQTNEKIKDLLPQGSITPDTTVVLTNAIYFKGSWYKKFDEDLTAEGPFHRIDGTTVTADMMQIQTKTRYARGAGFDAVELPYASPMFSEYEYPRELSMLLIVPDKGAFETVESALDKDQVDATVASLAMKTVNLTLPKFEFECEVSCKPLLQNLGMEDAFEPMAADFGNMVDPEISNPWIDEIFHKAFVAVDEEGTEAAAATAVVMTETSLPEVVTVTADKPFIFLIRDHITGTILFMGRVLDPAA